MSGPVLHPLDVKLLRDARRLWGQLLAAAFVLASGVTVLVMSQYLFATLSETQSAYYERYRFAHVFAGVRRAPLRLQAEIEAIDGVRDAVLRIQEAARLDMPGLIEPASSVLVSIPRVGRPAVNDLILSQGRWPTPGRHDEAIISNEFAAAWALDPGDAVTAIINGRERDVRIVGIGQSPEFIYAIAPGDIIPQHERFAIVWMARDSLERAFDLDGAFNDVALRLERGANGDAVVTELDAILDRYGGSGAFLREDQLSHTFIEGEIAQNEAMGRILPPIFLGVAAFMLHVAISRLIDTEREQIGLMKAFGYTNTAVGSHYIKLAMIPGLVGGVGGLIGGSWVGDRLSYLYAEFYNLPFVIRDIPTSAYVISFLIAVGVCVSGAIAAVRKAVILDPAVAMRPPAPARFARGWADTLGLIRLLSGPARIIVRNISRAPFRSGLTVLGVGAGCGTIVASTFLYDSMDYLMQEHFKHMDRSEITMKFPHEQPERVLMAIAHLPGVRDVEGGRIVPVEMVNGVRRERVGLQGLRSDASLNRPVDDQLAPLAIPDEGVLMSRYLAEKLDLHLGDDVRMKVLDGRRPTLNIPLVGMVDDHIGVAAYMSAQSLARALKEAPSVSSAYVHLDMAQYEEFFEAAKESPVIQAVSARQIIVDKFRETLRQNITIFTTMFYIFAGTICFGIVYNAARIALSERGRELASLRVLGFTRGEVSYILLGELALLVVLALPVGCMIGWAIGWVIITSMFDADLVRPPFFILPVRYANAMTFTIVFATISGLIVRRRIDQLDLVEVLKTRE